MKEGMYISNKSPASTLCIDPPETFNLLSLQVQSGPTKNKKGLCTYNFDDTKRREKEADDACHETIGRPNNRTCYHMLGFKKNSRTRKLG